MRVEGTKIGEVGRREMDFRGRTVAAGSPISRRDPWCSRRIGDVPGIFRAGDGPHRNRRWDVKLRPPKLSPDERPHGWQYPAGVVIILLMAALAWWLLSRR
jgi:hypothetical protein